MNKPKQWSTQAVNLPDHADNLIHTDAGAQAAGFERALVAGTTVYAYMTHPAVEAWGRQWLEFGGGELRLRKPVFDEDPVDCMIDATSENGTVNIKAEVNGEVRATLKVWRTAKTPKMRSGEALKTIEAELSDENLNYGLRAGDDLTLYSEERIPHPVTWANLANTAFKSSLVTGPWVHVRSRIFHEGLARFGSSIRVESVLIERFDSRAGERAVVDMRMYADDHPVATIEHEAIITLA